MTLPLPAFVKTGRVLGKQIVVDVDTPLDVDTEPDASYPVGAVLTFAPSVPYLNFGVDHATVYPQVIRATVGNDGQPKTPNGDELRLIANIGQVDNDQDWGWDVTVKIGSQSLPPFRFDVHAGTDNYLSDAQPIPAATPSSVVARGPAGPGVVDVELDGSGHLVATMSDGSTVTTATTIAAILSGVYVPQPASPAAGVLTRAGDGTLTWAAASGGGDTVVTW